MENSSVKLMRVTENDLALLMDWRMRPEVSKTLFTNPVITMDSQRIWYAKLKNDKSQIRWIIYYDKVPIGSIYIVDIDYNNRRCESGVFIAEKQYNSMELYMNIHWNLFEYIFNVLGLNRIFAYIMSENGAVVKLSKYMGLDIEGTLRQHSYKDGSYHDVIVVGITKQKWLMFKQKVNVLKYYIE